MVSNSLKVCCYPSTGHRSKCNRGYWTSDLAVHVNPQNISCNIVQIMLVLILLHFAINTDNFYRIDHLLCIVLSSIRGNPPLLTDDTVKMIDFSSIFYRFQMLYRYPQEFGEYCIPVFQLNSTFFY